MHMLTLAILGALQADAALRFRQALRCLRPSTADLVSWEVLSRIALAAHHPRMQAGAAPTAWQTATLLISSTVPDILEGERTIKPHREKWRASFPLDMSVSAAVIWIADHVCPAGHAKEIIAFLLGANGMSSSRAAQQLAAKRALGSLTATAPDALYPDVMARVTPLLDRTAHNAVRVFCQPQLSKTRNQDACGLAMTVTPCTERHASELLPDVHLAAAFLND